jgi:hypothetical protein
MMEHVQGIYILSKLGRVHKTPMRYPPSRAKDIQTFILLATRSAF